MDIYEKIYDTVLRIPKGRVASYGRIARMVGCGPRQVGYAMGTIPDGLEVPWHRVVNSQGKVSPRGDGGSDNEQRRRLLAEGVIFNNNGKIDFERFGWHISELPEDLSDWEEIIVED